MGKTKQIKAEQIAAAPKQSAIILASYKPMPRFKSGCKYCWVWTTRKWLLTTPKMAVVRQRCGRVWMHSFVYFFLSCSYLVVCSNYHYGKLEIVTWLYVIIGFNNVHNAPTAAIMDEIKVTSFTILLFRLSNDSDLNKPLVIALRPFSVVKYWGGYLCSAPNFPISGNGIIHSISPSFTNLLQIVEL